MTHDGSHDHVPGFSDDPAWAMIERQLEEEKRKAMEDAASHLGGADNLIEFLASGSTAGYGEHDWVIPGLFEHRDKMIVTGPSGKGKSTLLRQVALCASAGVWPFDRAPRGGANRAYAPAVTVYLDCENRPSQTWRAFRTLTDRFTTQYGSAACSAAGSNLHVKVREEGLDLLNPVNVERLLDFIGGICPDLVILGPLYYLAYGDPNLEATAATVARALRTITTEFNAALLLEAHSAKVGSSDKPRTDPQGSNLWIKWPDFGRSLFPMAEPGMFEFAQFRGDREVRTEMPDYLRLDWPSHDRPAHFLPWYADTPDGDDL